MKSNEPKSNRMCSVWVHFLKEVFKFGFVGAVDVTVGRGLAPAEISKEPKITKIFGR